MNSGNLIYLDKYRIEIELVYIFHASDLASKPNWICRFVVKREPNQINSDPGLGPIQEQRDRRMSIITR